MKPKYIYTIFIAAILTMVVLYIRSSKQVGDAIDFADMNIHSSGESIKGIEGYITIPTITADEDAVMDLIGTVMIRTRNDDGSDSWNYDTSRRPTRDSIRFNLSNEELFHGIVKAGIDLDGRFEILSASASANELAEVRVTNDLVAGYDDPSVIPFDSLSKIKAQPGRDYFFVERVVLTSISTRRFREHESGTKIEGLAFGANGSVYAERGTMETRKFVSFRPINLLDIQPSEAGSGQKLTELSNKARRGTLSVDEAEQLREILLEKSKTILPKEIKMQAPPRRLPTRLQGMVPKIWIDDLAPVKQSSGNRCWAAVTAMLMSWKSGESIGEVQAISSLGRVWMDLYEKDRALPRSYKYDFMKTVGFAYSAPQSYMPEGLISLLVNNGPIWFTIDQNLGRHATVLTGVFQEADQSYWVSYIDPTDGTLVAESYVSYMQKYQEPAYRANEEGLEAAMTERDLDIQVIHW